MGDRTFDNTLDGVVAKINDFKAYKADDKPPKYNEKIELEALISGLQTKLSVNNRPAFAPPSGLSTADIDNNWNHLGEAERERALALRYELRRQKKILDLLRKFKQLAGKLEAWASDRQTSLNSKDNGDTVSACQAKLKNLDAFESEFSAQTAREDKLKDIAGQLEELKYNDMGSIHNRANGINTTFGHLQGASQNRRQALEQHLAHLLQIENLLLEFAQRGLAFRVFLENADDTLTDPITVETVEGVSDLQSHFTTFTEEKAQMEAEFHSIGELAANCKQLGVAENTYSEVSWASLQDGWNRIGGLVKTRHSELDAEFAKQQHNEQLRLDFAHKAKSFNDWAKSKQHEIESLSGDLQSQLSTLGHITQQIAAGQAQFHEVVAAQQALEDARVSDNPHTELSVEGLKGSWDAVNVLSRKKQQVLEKELLDQSGSGLSADQLREFKECFKHFDKDEDSFLSRLELGACLKSLGEDVNFDQGGKLDQILQGIDADNDGKVSFEEFASYMERVSSGSDTPDSIKHAFKTLAGDKDYVTEADLRAVLPGDKVDYCLAHMKKHPGNDNAYDYNSFTDTLYGR